MSYGPSPIGELLGGLQGVRLIRAYKKAVGPHFEKKARFLGLKKSSNGCILKIQVADPVWRHELQYQKEEILKRFREAMLSEGFDRSEIPSECLFVGISSLPFKSRNP